MRRESRKRCGRDRRGYFADGVDGIFEAGAPDFIAPFQPGADGGNLIEQDAKKEDACEGEQ